MCPKNAIVFIIKNNYPCISQMKILTYANKHKRQLDNLISSLEKYNYTPIVVGMGEVWHGVINKTRGYSKALKELDDENEIVALVDAYDVMVCRDVNITRRKYIKLTNGKDKIVFCGERMCAKGINCKPLDNWWSNRKRPITQYLNSGIIVGSVKKLRELFEWMLKSKIRDDQLAAIDYVENNPNNIIIDYNHKLIATVTGMDFLDFVVKDGCVINTRTSQKPCLIHIPGSGFDLNFRIDWIGRKILENYKPDPNSYSQRFVYYVKRNWWAALILMILFALSVYGIFYHLKITVVVCIILIIIITTYTRCFF